jgi:predicted transposase/invertase (TIGR01784 family)
MRFMQITDSDEVEELATMQPIFKEAYEEIKRISGDPEIQQIVDDREKSDLLWKISIGSARQEGLVEGKHEGRKEGRKEQALEIAKNLLGLLEPEVIAQKTGLTIDQVRELQKEIRNS